MSRPRCPKCGEPARTVGLRRAYVTAALNADGSVGRILQVSARFIEDATAVHFECGGGHVWTGEYTHPRPGS